MTRIRVSSDSTHSGFGVDGGKRRACSTVVESLKLVSGWANVMLVELSHDSYQD